MNTFINILILLLVICLVINNTKIKNKCGLITIIVIGFITLELLYIYRYKPLEHFYLDLHETQYNVPDSTLTYPTQLEKPFTKYSYIRDYDYQRDLISFSYSNKEPFSITVNDNYVYFSNNIFSQNSRKIERLDLNQTLNKRYVWEKPIEMDNLYHNEALARIRNNNNKYEASTLTYKKITFFAGGCSYREGLEKLSNNITIYESNWNNWFNTTFPSNEAKIGVSIYEHMNYIFFVGGFLGKSGNMAYSNKVEMYNANKGHYSNKNTWSYDILPSGGRCNISIGATGSKVIFCGGFNYFGFSNKIDIYDLNQTGYKWATIDLPNHLTGLYLNVVSLNDYCILSTGITYPYNINHDYNLAYFFNNGNLYSSKNLLKPIKTIVGLEQVGIYGISYTIDNWVSHMYQTFLDDGYRNYSIILWVKLKNITNSSPTWIFRNNDITKFYPNILLDKGRIYPVVFIEGYAFKYTEGIEANTNWMCLSVIFNYDGVSYINLDYHSKLSFKIKPSMSLGDFSKGMVITNLGKKIDINMKTAWNKGSISQIKIYNRVLNQVNIHNNYMLNYERFYNVDIESESEEPNNSLSIYSYSKDSQNPLVYKFDGGKIKPFFTYTILSNKRLFNLLGESINKKYAFFYGTELYKHKNKYFFKEVIIIYDSINDIWTVSEPKVNNNGKSSTNDNTISYPFFSIDSNKESIILGGIKYDDSGNYKNVFDIIKLPKYTPPPRVHEEAPIKENCPHGHAIINDKCQECPVNYYSDGVNSTECTPCQPSYTTNNKTGQSSCVPDNKYYDPSRVIDTSLRTNYDIKKQMDKYHKQKRKYNLQQDNIDSLTKKLNLFISQYSNTGKKGIK